MAELEIWQDRDVRFDVRSEELKLRPGEQLFEKLTAVEDTKGNNGERGCMLITSLRLIWYCTNLPRVNLSIGWNCVSNISMKTVTSRLRGEAEACYLLTRANDARYEFLFTNLSSATSRLVTTIAAVHRAYDASRAYRDVKIRSAIIQNKQLKLLPQEEIMSVVNGVWNLSNEQGNLGAFFVTNVRVVWYAAMNDNFNVSVPYMQMTSVKVRSSKFGTALVIECTKSSGGYVLGFRIDPEDKLMGIAKELHRLHAAFSLSPVLGVSPVLNSSDSAADHTMPVFADDVEIERTPVQKDVLAMYYSDGGVQSNRDIVFSEELGVAIEAPPAGLTLKDLWEVAV